MLQSQSSQQSNHQHMHASIDNQTMHRIMGQVYGWMTIAIGMSALSAVITIESDLASSIQNNALWLFLLLGAQLILVIGLGSTVETLAPMTAIMLFLSYAALLGTTLAIIIEAYTSASVITAFLSALTLFAAMSILGATTDIDLSRYSSVFLMGMIGILAGLILNIFWGNGWLDFVLSLGGVLVFTALTAYDTQRIREYAAYVAERTNHRVVTRSAIMGALVLYLDLVNLFIFLLRLTAAPRH